MFAVVIFSNENNKPFVGLIADKRETAGELHKVSEAVESYTFIRAGSATANEYLLRAYEVLNKEA